MYPKHRTCTVHMFMYVSYRVQWGPSNVDISGTNLKCPVYLGVLNSGGPHFEVPLYMCVLYTVVYCVGHISLQTC